MNPVPAIVFGIGFGYILYRVGALDYHNIINTLRLKDLTIAKFMLFSVAISAVGIFGLRTLGLVSLDLIPTNPWANLAGGLIFGVGFALSGYCPGTSIGAWAEGKKDAGYTILGGLLGVLVYTLLQQAGLLQFSGTNFGEISLIDLLPFNAFTTAVLFSVMLGGLVYAMDYWDEKRRAQRNEGGV
ncbi:YeeE/YedE thiosulfate transporter family protein [Capillibacterium thermochitinicola]|uniref:YeeE/YedE family protein n=1 Tax=Capillibacterium thermochitinicola TaxID=2699427 RepID=A0A8J6LIS3_9FIRM|nr:YeeE/YedE thiosulfate transporter family protein [Capillibacterium thermochitinicola]MBA2132961.1 YeeE/YedE family protein [Capillibacterium thermochitinicola]